MSDRGRTYTLLHPFLPASRGCVMGNAQNDGGQERNQQVTSSPAGPFHQAALHALPVADPPHLCTSRCASLLGPPSPQLTTWTHSYAQSQAAPLLRGASIQPRSKSRLPYQTRFSLNFYRPDSIINELSVPRCRTPS